MLCGFLCERIGLRYFGCAVEKPLLAISANMLLGRRRSVVKSVANDARNRRSPGGVDPEQSNTKTRLQVAQTKMTEVAKDAVQTTQELPHYQTQCDSDGTATKRQQRERSTKGWSTSRLWEPSRMIIFMFGCSLALQPQCAAGRHVLAKSFTYIFIIIARRHVLQSRPPKLA